jgi:eukaryotic-like serine/threonine-protein kinase
MSVATGTRLGPYEILGRIGAGGMSEVYRAYDSRLRRDVAVKVLAPTVAKYADRLHRFEQEARAAGALNHPNLLTIFDVGSTDGQAYIVTELLEGQTLRALLRENGTSTALPLRKAIDYGIQIAHGLAAAHERGIVHRDLKPENLFVTKDGRVKILDFGVAKLRSAEDQLQSHETTIEQGTSPGTVIGTAGYMSPEQVRGQHVDGRSDLFSLGTVLFEMVTGEHPFRGDSPADTMSAILREDPPSLTALNANVTPGIERVVRHCLEKSPEERFQSARDLAFQLDMLTSGSGTIPTIESELPADFRRVWLLAGALTLLAAGLLGGWFLHARASNDRAPMHFTQLTHSAGMEIAPSIAPDGETFVFARNGDIHLQRVTGRNAINLTARCTAADSQPAFSPDGSMIAYRSECDGGGIFVMGATGESARRIVEGCFNPSWSPDSAQIVCATEPVNYTPTSRGTTSALWVVDVRNGAKRVLLERDGVQPNWSPNGDRIAYWGMTGESSQRDVWTIDPHDDEPRKTVRRVTHDEAVDWDPLWAPDGQHLYYGSDRGGAMSLWRIPIRESTGRPRGEAEAVVTPARFSAHYSMSRDASRMLYSAIEQTEAMRIVSFDPQSGAIVSQPRDVMAGSFLVFSSMISPDGRFVAMTNRGGQEDLFVLEIATGEIRQLTNDPARDRGVAWSPDGNRIYFYSHREDARYEIWSINRDGSGLTRVTRTQGRSVWYPSVAPDGKRISFFNDENTFLLDTSANGARVEPLPPAGGADHPALSAWSPDGTRIAGEFRGKPGIVLYSLSAKKYTRLTESGARPMWLPGGREILFADGGRLRIVNADTRAVRDVVTPFPVTAVSLSTDGRTLLFANRQTEADIWMMSAEARPGS